MTTDYFLAKQPPTSDGLDSPLSPTTPGLTSRANTALSSKVSSVLSASYADLEIRDALGLLDIRGIENSAETRRRLRLDIQKDVIQSNGDIIQEFGLVAEVIIEDFHTKQNTLADQQKQLKRIGQSIRNLNQGCDEMRKQVATAREQTEPTLQEATELMTEKEQGEKKQRILKTFNTHFIMSEDDIAILTSTAEPVNDEFFVVLSRAKKIQSDCEILLGTENQRLGLEIVEQVSKNLNGAFQKLYRWIQREFKALNLENPQISSSIRRSLRALAERPSLFQSCLDFFAEARENVLSDAFYTALTGTSVSGEQDKSIKPIELVAHDPLRYVGDMLAWTHSATVSEREALEVLFISDGDEIAKGIQAGRDNEPWNKYAEDNPASQFDGMKALNELVDRDVIGVGRILRQRIEQVIQSHEETIMAYKIGNLLNFYRITFSKLLGSDSSLLETFVSLEESAMRQFRALTRDHIAGLQGEFMQVPIDFGPPDYLQTGLKQLSAIMKTYETSFPTTESREGQFKVILADAFEPYLSAAETTAGRLTPPSSAIFHANCLLVSRSTLSPFEFNTSCVADLEETLSELSAQLIEAQYTYFIESSGLEPLLKALNPSPGVDIPLEDIPALPAFQPQALTEAGQTLDDFLPSALMDAMENLKQLHSSKMAREVTEEAAERFCEDFERIEDKIIGFDATLEDVTEYQSLRTLFPRTSGEIRVLLS